jgi:hypothetical protein
VKRIAPLAAAIVTCVACAKPTDPLDGDVIAIQTPSFTIQPGEEKFYCYFTSLPATSDTGVYRFTSSMTPGSHHMIVFKTKTAQAADGTFGECDGFGQGSGLADIPVWLYASQNPESELVMPDGVGVALAASQPVMVNMHYVNTTDAPITANVNLELDTFAPGAKYTEAHAYITYNTKIDIPAGAVGMVSGSCDVDPATQFIMMSTHSHKYTMSAKVMDGATQVLETLDWQHATVQQWEAPFFSFASGKLDYSCQYRNTTTMPLTTGESALANEMCMAVGLQFPATGDTFCLNSQTITL